MTAIGIGSIGSIKLGFFFFFSSFALLVLVSTKDESPVPLGTESIATSNGTMADEASLKEMLKAQLSHSLGQTAPHCRCSTDVSAGIHNYSSQG